MRAGADGRQRVSAGVVMIKSPGKSFAPVDRQIELEPVAGARRRIRPGGVLDQRRCSADVYPVFPSRQDARGVVKKPRKLGERDRTLVIEVTGGMTFVQN